MGKLDKLRIPLLLFLLCTSMVGLVVSVIAEVDGSKVAFVDPNTSLTPALKKVAYITGAVEYPGIYEIQSTTTLAELVSLAGGFRVDADGDYVSTELNLAAVVEDHEHIEVPVRQATATAITETIPPSTTASDAKVNLNTASAAELDTLPGVGPSLSASIIAARPFNSLSDLQHVKGIGDAKYAQLEPLVTL